MRSVTLKVVAAAVFAVGAVALIAISTIDFQQGRDGAGATALVLASLCVVLGSRIAIVFRRSANLNERQLASNANEPRQESLVMRCALASLSAIIGTGVGYLVGRDVTGAVAGGILGGLLGALGAFTQLPREFLGDGGKPLH